MAVSISTPTDAVNAALVRIGFKQFIGNMRDGSEAAQTAVQVYGQTRDNLLRLGNWDFCSREIALTLLKFAPAAYVPGVTPWDPTTNPPLSYKFEYAYPDGCLKLRAVRPAPIFVPTYDPRPWAFRIANDNYFTPPQRVILTNLQDAIAVYSGRVTDLTTMPPDFVEALIEALAQPLAAALTTMDAAKAEAAESRVDKSVAAMEQG